jgi:membrane associated rhomboid family serine protease
MLGLVPFRLLPKSVRVLLLLNLGVFIPSVLFSLFRAEGLIHWVDALMLIPSQYYQPWRFITYAFVHTAPLHFLFNMLMLWMFGDEVAQWLGNRTFTALYLVSAVFAGLLSLPFYAGSIVPVHILGASGALFGVMVAYGWLFPDRRMLLFLIFPVSSRVAVGIFVLIDLFMSRTNDGIAHFTHLGGVVAGLVFMAFYTKLIPLPGARLLWNMRKRKYMAQTKSLQGEVGYLDEQKQLDSVLAKISRSGMGSLTQGEISFLQAASEKNRARRGS